jgi:choline kinase
MKLVTLAAGLGKRVQKNGSYIPKAMIEVSGQTLVKWSIDSFHALRSQGLLKQSDLVFVVRQLDCDQYDFEGYLRNTFGQSIHLVKLEKLSKGPADSAYLGIKKLLEEGIISSNEPVIINDCDHYFAGDRLTRTISELLNEEIDTIQVFETNKEPEDLAWSFVRENCGDIIGISEKPDQDDLEGINIEKGLIGVYAFSKSRNFLELYEDCQGELVEDSEMFLSHVLSGAISKSSVKLDRIFIEYFISMGTESKIAYAQERLLSPLRLKDPSTIFIDLDGTLVLHDTGLLGDEGKFSKELIPLDEQELQTLHELWNEGTKIVITTARPEFERINVLHGLTSMNIRFDQLIMGITGGTRYLVNDSKDSVPSFPTAIAVQVNRDKPEFSSISTAIKSARHLVIEHEYLGESGERTLLMNMEGLRFVRKVSQSSSNSKSLIDYQAKWMQQVAELLPENFPKILETFSDRLAHQSYFDMEYLPNLEPLGQRIFSVGYPENETIIEKAVSTLDKIYSTYRIESKQDYSYLVNVLKDKALNGYKIALKNLNFDVNAREFPLFVNKSRVYNIYSKLIDLVESPERRFLSAIYGNSNIQTLIHGDPTLSNLVTDDRNRIFLLDPIGTRVLPNYSSEEFGLGRTHPFFDYTRIQLSLQDEYERWSRDIAIDETSSILQVTFNCDSTAKINYSTFTKHWNSDYSMPDPLLAKLFYLTTLCRILPYKSKDKKKEAYYMLSLIQDVMRQMDQDIYD